MGGMKSFFSNMFGKKKSIPKDDSAFTVTDNPLFEAADNEFENPFFNDSDVAEGRSSYVSESDSEMVDEKRDSVSEGQQATRQEADQEASVSANSSELQKLDSELRSTKKTHSKQKSSGFSNFSNSQAYENVLDALHQSLTATNGSFSADTEANQKMVKNAAVCAARLAEACRGYLAKNKITLSTSGRNRHKKIAKILALAERDRAGLWTLVTGMHKMTAEQQAGLSWDRVLRDARVETIEVDDLYDEKQHQTFGKGMKVGDMVSREVNGSIFSPEMIGKANGTEEEKENLNKLHVNTFGMDFDEKIHSSVDRNISQRNVASSRVASLLGIGDLLAESKNVIVHDKKTDTTIQGNLMEFATGQQASKVLSSSKKDVIREGGLDFRKREALAKDKVSLGATRDLMNLQILDYLCQQNDRNNTNYFLQQDESGMITGVKGIDNDMAFGTSTDYEHDMTVAGASNWQSGVYQKAVIDSQGNMTVPLMDKQLAMNILQLKPEELKYALVDLIEPDAIEAAVTRLTKLQTCIQKTMAEEPNRFVDTWTKERQQEILDQSMLYKHKINQQGADLKSIEAGLFNGGINFYKRKDMKTQFEMTKGNTIFSYVVTKMMGAISDDSDSSFVLSNHA